MFATLGLAGVPSAGAPSSVCVCSSYLNPQGKGAEEKFDLFLWAGKAGFPCLSLDGIQVSEVGLLPPTFAYKLSQSLWKEHQEIGDESDEQQSPAKDYTP